MAFISMQIRKMLHMEFYDPKLNFWEELPKSIKGIEFRIESRKEKPNTSSKFFLSNLGEKGCFLFREEGNWSFPPSFIHINLGVFGPVTFAVEPVLYVRNKRGVGLRFKNMTNKHLQNRFYQYLNDLRRVGYVQS